MHFKGLRLVWRRHKRGRVIRILVPHDGTRFAVPHATIKRRGQNRYTISYGHGNHALDSQTYDTENVTLSAAKAIAMMLVRNLS